MATQVFDDDTRRFGRLLHYGGLLAAVLGATAVYSLLHAPTVHATAETSIRIEEIRLSAQNAPLLRERHRQVSDQLAAVERRIAAVHARVPTDADAGAFLKAVTQLASEEKLDIRDFQPEKPVAKTGYAEMEVKLNGAGSFHSICGFLDRLARLPRLAKVKSLTVSADDDSNKYPMTATLIIYFGISNTAGSQSKEVRRG
jgi:Tfp pilus assembly protein PilO